LAYFEEDQIRQIVEAAARRLGANATANEVRNIVQQVIARMDSDGDEISSNSKSIHRENINSDSSRVILTAFGRNQPGVIAAITKVLADNSCDIQDMMQKMMQEFYSLMIIFDIGGSEANFDTIRDQILSAGDAIGAKCLIQHEDIFKEMHRV